MYNSPLTSKMDYQFPQQLFPSFYNDCAPPDSLLELGGLHGDWGGYDRVRPQFQPGTGPLSSYTFTSRHRPKGETWSHTEPLPLPLLSPKNAVLWPLTPPDPLDVTEHMENFFMDNCQDAFGSMSELIGDNFHFPSSSRKSQKKDSVNLWRVKSFCERMKMKICQRIYSSKTIDAYSVLLSDSMHSIPPELLGTLLHEELTEQRDRLLFSEGSTGGALAFVPFSHSNSEHGCLLYPGNQGMDCLNFHRVELQHHRGGPSCVDASSSEPLSFQLKSPIRQISHASLLDDCCVGVRSDHLCGLWRFNERNEPRLLQIVNTEERATCISVSPHVLGEVLVASESGTANLWTVGRGMQKVREEEHNLYFNAKSSWRWCEFSAHPRVMLYADRTGVELTDFRVSPFQGHTLFRISKTSECRSGERLILSKYLGDAHSFHHLITTQYSAYIMDERFPGVPMLKWGHMMQAPPVFSHVVPGAASSGSAAKVMLGSHISQEITMLQYSGGRAEACCSLGPPLALFTPKDSLKHLPVQLPHRLHIATQRLSSPAAGLTCIQKRGGGEEACVCVLQLTEAGDIFYQILEPEQADMSPPPAEEDQPLSQQAGDGTKRLQRSVHVVVSDTSSDESVIGPTQHPNAQTHVAETPERIMFSDSDSDDLESGRRVGYLKRLGLQVFINDDPELDEPCESGTGGNNVIEEKNNAQNTEATVSSSLSSSEKRIPVKLSDNTLVTWRRWLQKLVQNSRKKKPRHLNHYRVETKRFLGKNAVEAERDSDEEERVQNLKRDLRASMSRRSLLVDSALSASLTPPDLVKVPNQVDTKAWKDPLSQRLTVSWQGTAAWQVWWGDELGLNKEDKMAALRRKRRREKEARRASGRCLELSRSFTSSPASSHRSDLDDFSDYSGWSSSAAWSDSENMSQGFSEPGTPRATTPPTPDHSPTATPPPETTAPPIHEPSPPLALTLTHTPAPETPATPIHKRDATLPPKTTAAPVLKPAPPLALTPTHTPTPKATAIPIHKLDPTPALTPALKATATPIHTPAHTPALKATATPIHTPALTPALKATATPIHTPALKTTATPIQKLTAALTHKPAPSPGPTPQSVKGKQGEQQKASSSQTPAPVSTPASQRRNKRPANDILNSLFGSQEDASQYDFVEMETDHQQRPPLASSSQAHSSQSASQRGPGAGQSQDFYSWSGFSSFRPLSQGSQGRPGSSQPSQKKKRSSQMGF